MEENINEFNCSLFKRMRKMGFSQRDFAKKMGVTTNTIFNWENGKCIPNRENLAKIEHIFGVKKHYFEIFERTDLEMHTHTPTDTTSLNKPQPWQAQLFSFLRDIAILEEFIPNITELSQEDRQIILTNSAVFKSSLLEAIARSKNRRL